MTSTIRAVNAMRNTIFGDMELEGQNHIIVPLLVRDCTGPNVVPGDRLRIKIDVGIIELASKDVSSRMDSCDVSFFNGVHKIPCESDRGRMRFMKGLHMKTYADFRLDVTWSEDNSSYVVDRCLIVVPHEWYVQYLSRCSKLWDA